MSAGNGKPLSPLETLHRHLDLVRTRVISAATKHINGVCLFGPSGVGKTYTVIDQLKKCGVDWVEAPTVITPQGTLELLEQHPDSCILQDDVYGMLTTEKARKYWMKALGDRPDYTEPRRIKYKREGQETEIKFTGSVIVITNTETCPAAFASRVFCLEHKPTDEQAPGADDGLGGAGQRTLEDDRCGVPGSDGVPGHGSIGRRVPVRLAKPEQGVQRLCPVAFRPVAGALEGLGLFRAPAESSGVETSSPRAAISCVSPRT